MSGKLMNKLIENDIMKITCSPAGDGGGVAFLHKLVIHPELPCLVVI